MPKISLVGLLSLGLAVHACAGAVDRESVLATRIIGLDDVKIEHNGETQTASNLGTLVVVGEDAYATKTNTKDGPGWTVFYKVADFLSSHPVVTASTVRMHDQVMPADMGHGNGLAYSGGAFYLAMIHKLGDYQIAQLNEHGRVVRQFKVRHGETDKQAASITPYRDGAFIIGTAGENMEEQREHGLVVLKPYYIARIDGDVFRLERKFYVPTNGTYNLGQATHYVPETDEFLVPVWDGKSVTSEATRRGNRVIVVKLGGVEHGATYSPSRWLDYKATEIEASLFEFEGIARTDVGGFYVSANVVNAEGRAIDGIYKISDKN